MRFSLTPDSANELYRFAKVFVDPKCYHESLTLIACEISNGILTATMVNQYSVCKLTLPVKGEDGVCFITPPQKKFSSKDVAVIIDDDESETSYTTSITKQTFLKSAHGEKVFPYPPDAEPKARIWMNPTLLAKSLGAFATEIVRIDVFSDKEGIRLSNEYGQKAMVLPCHPPRR